MSKIKTILVYRYECKGAPDKVLTITKENNRYGYSVGQIQICDMGHEHEELETIDEGFESIVHIFNKFAGIPLEKVYPKD